MRLQIYCPIVALALLSRVALLKAVPAVFLWYWRCTGISGDCIEGPALLFAAIGDLFLELDGDLAMTLGIGSFAVFQICWLVGWGIGPMMKRQWILYPGIGASLSFLLLYPYLKAMVVPVVLYSLLSTFFVNSALQHSDSTSFGVGCFVISDIIILTEIVLTKMQYSVPETGIILYFIALALMTTE